MSIKDDIQSLSDSGWDNLSGGVKSRLKQSGIPLGNLQEISDKGFSGVSPTTLSAIHSVIGPNTNDSDAPIDVVTGKPRVDSGDGLTTLEPISGGYLDQVTKTLLPNTVAASDAGKGAGGVGLGWLRDIGSLPGRTVLGIGAGVGAALQGGDDAISQGAQTMQSVMGSPMGTQYVSGGSLGSKAANLGARIITDPSLPLAASTGGLSEGAGALFSSPILASAARLATQGSLGAGEGALSSPGNEGTGALIGGVGNTAAGGLAEGAGFLGNKLKNSANKLLTSQIKPAPMVNKGQEAKGLQTFLSAGKLPDVTGPLTLSVPGVAENFEKRFLPIQQSFGPTLADLDARGVTVNVPQAVASMEQSLNDAKNTNPQGLSLSDLRNAARWAEDRLPNPSQVGESIWDTYPSTPLGLPASLGHSTKSSLLDAAYKDPTQETARGVAAMGLGQDFRSQLMSEPEYAALMQKSAPYYAAEAAMKRASTKANRNPISLSSALHPILALQETPATAWGLWQAGNVAPSVGDLARGLSPYAIPVGAEASQAGGR